MQGSFYFMDFVLCKRLGYEIAAVFVIMGRSDIHKIGDFDANA